eukprot:1783932-Amphidinium_carterae.1
MPKLQSLHDDATRGVRIGEAKQPGVRLRQQSCLDEAARAPRVQMLHDDATRGIRIGEAKQPGPAGRKRPFSEVLQSLCDDDFGMGA